MWRTFLFLLICFGICNSREENSNLIKSIENFTNSNPNKINYESIFISESEIRIIEKSIQNLNSNRCKNDLIFTLQGIIQGLPWAIAMYDSSVKAPVGIESGSIYQFGNFDECVYKQNDDDDTRIHANNNNLQPYKKITTKYCLTDVTMNGLIVRSLASRKYQPSNSTLVHWGICVPSSCTPKDVELFMQDILHYPIHVDENKCYEHKPFEFDNGMIIYGSILLCFIIMTVFSTIYHVFILIRKNYTFKENSLNCIELGVLSFSMIENLKKLVQPSNDQFGLTAINGIKAFSMLCIIFGHGLLFVVAGPVENSDFFAIDIKRLQNAFLLNSPLFVDTFFLLSGFLFCRILLKELERRQGKVNLVLLYIFRYIRLTPAYLAIIGFYAIWLPKIGSGPLWNSRIILEQKRCQESWWLNILYINNYFGTDKLCMFQSWYLAADTQLFILASLVIYIIWKSRKLGLIILSGLTMFTVLLPFVLTYLNNLDPTLLAFADEIEDISANEFFSKTYIKTHMRSTAYVFGLFTGFILHYLEEKNIKIHKNLCTILWIFSTIVGFISMYSITIFFIKPFTQLESSLYAGFHRLGWSFCMSWLVLAITTKNAGFIKSILSSRIFIPISRLTYCAYLTNGLVELYLLGSLRVPVSMNHINLIGVTTSHVVHTFILALFLCLLFESPIHGIEKIFLKLNVQKRESNSNPRTPSTSEETA